MSCLDDGGSAPRSVLITLLAGAATAAALAFAACANPDTQNPSCTNNVDQYGIHPSDTGCDQLATCTKGPPAACCTTADGGPLGTNDLLACLHGYGDPNCAYLLTTPVEGGVLFTCSDGGDLPDGG
jgi:hypothetical protein